MNVKFVCPDCGGNRLECILYGTHVAEITNIDEEGDFDYGEYESSGDIERFQCLTCGYVLTGRFGYSDWPLSEQDEVVKWCLEHCSQE